MCGIIHIEHKDGKSPVESILKRFEAQKSRGQEGFGFVALDKGKITGYERTETADGIKAKLARAKGNEIMFHHRMPTSTENLEEAAHPIKVSHESLKHDYYLIHNGIIWEDEIWKKMHEKMGFIYSTIVTYEMKRNGKVIKIKQEWNDSEALAIELARDLDSKKEGISVEGSIAFICLQTDKKGNAVNLFWGRNNGSPLLFENVADYMSLASEGDGEAIEANTLYSKSYADSKITEMPYKVGKCDWADRMSVTTIDDAIFDAKTFNSRAETGFRYPEEMTYEDFYLNLLDKKDDLTAELETAVMHGDEIEQRELEVEIADLEVEIQQFEQPTKNLLG